MADVLEAMGFPSEWCERALRSTSGIQPAVELLLQWQADGGAPAAEGPTAEGPTLRLSGNPSTSTAISTVTATASAGADAVVPDAYADERKRRADAAMRLKQERDAEKMKVRQHMLEDKANRRWRNELAAVAPAVAPSSQAGNSKSENFVDLQIRCSGHPNMKGTFSADATLKEVREFVLQELQQQQLPQAIAMPSSGAGRCSGRVAPFSGTSAALSSDRDAQRAILEAARENYNVQSNRILAHAKMMRSGQSSAGAPAALFNQARGTLYFLIPIPRTVYDTEASMETTLRQANLVPRGALTVQFQSKESASSSAQVVIPSESSRRPQEGVHVGRQHAQSRGASHVDQHLEDTEKREQRLKATVDRLSQRRYSESLDTGMAAAVVSTPSPTPTPTPAPSPASVVPNREERSLEVDGARVRNRELALQAAAKRMSEAAQIFREGLPPDEGESGGGFHTPSDVLPVPPLASNEGTVREPSNLHLSRLAKFNPGNQDVKGKQAADCGPSVRHTQPTEAQAHDVESHIAGPPVRTTRARMPLSSPLLTRPEKLQRTHEAINNTSAEVQYDSTFAARGHAMELAGGRNDVQETIPTEREKEGSSSSSESVVSELRIRLEDGNVVRHSFPAHTTLEAVCECVIPEGSSTAEYGLTLTYSRMIQPPAKFQAWSLKEESASDIIPVPGSHFMEGEALNSTLQEVGLVPRGMVHLQKVASRGLVTQGRQRVRRGMRYVRNDDNEPEPELEQLWQDFSRHMNPNLTYEELVELEDSIGRVNVGVPEAMIANLPTHIIARSDGDICIVCLAEMVEGDEVMSLPCVHTFHPACIRQWLLQSTCCPTCKHSLT